jgi:hypothetical protein
MRRLVRGSRVEKGAAQLSAGVATTKCNTIPGYAASLLRARRCRLSEHEITGIGRHNHNLKFKLQKLADGAWGLSR